jgi:hypothetical protein
MGRFKERIARLYEQDADINRIGQYVLKWAQWTYAVLYELHKINTGSDTSNMHIITRSAPSTASYAVA